jgi:hypothetical protein
LWRSWHASSTIFQGGSKTDDPRVISPSSGTLCSITANTVIGILLTASSQDLERKIELLIALLGTQQSKDWFDAEMFRGLARLRGMERRASEDYAEAFTLRELCLA